MKLLSEKVYISGLTSLWLEITCIPNIPLSERLTGESYAIHPGTPEHHKVFPGRMEVRVQAFLGGKWTQPTSITVSTPLPQLVSTPRLTITPPIAAQKYGWLMLLIPWWLLIYPLKEKIPLRRKVWNWVRTLILTVILTVIFGTIAVTLLDEHVEEWVANSIGLFSGAGLIFVTVKYDRRAFAKHAQRVEAAYKWALKNAHLPEPLKQPAERLCLAILSYEGAFQNRSLSPQRIGMILQLWLYNLLHNRRKEQQIPNLLSTGAGGEATFSVLLYNLHYDVAYAIRAVRETLRLQSQPDGRPFPRLIETVKDNFRKATGINSATDADFRKQLEYPQKLRDGGYSDPEIIGQFLDKTPFINFFKTELKVSIPVDSRFEHTHIVAGTGHGKTQLLQYLILHDLPHVAAGNRSVIVIDSQGSDSKRGLIKNILSLESVGAMADRVVLIDPKQYTPALNLFDLGLDRLTPSERRRVLNRAIELYKYIFGALLRADVTMNQDVIFTSLARLMMVVPGATIKTHRDFIRQPERTREYISELDEEARDFFETEFFDREYNATRKQLLRRLRGVLTETALASMFAAERNKLDLFSAMNRGSLILISTNKLDLNQDASEIFGRFFIALIRQAIRERELSDQYKLRDTFVYIDEAHEYFDESMGNLFEQVRKFNVGMVIAHQHLGQFKTELRDTVTGNTSVKLAGGVSYNDARDFAKEMNCEQKFVQFMRKREEADPPYTEFACYVKDKTDRAIALKVPLLEIEKRQPKMADGRRAALINQNRIRYGATDERPPEKPKDDDSPLGDPELL